MSGHEHTALIIGASRGLGLGMVREYVSRGWGVIATVRAGSSHAELGELAGVDVETVDINHTGEVLALRDRLAGRALDLLFVNAGVSNGPEETVADVSTEDWTRVMTTNALSPLRVIETLAGLVTASGTIAAMSSGLGSVAGNTSGGYEVYRASKAALNTLLRSYAVRAGQGRTVLAMHPGWVRTDMGGAGADLDVPTSVRGVADAIGARQGKGGAAFVNYKGDDLPW